MGVIDQFYFQNPWRKSTNFQVAPYFDRSILSQIENWLPEPEILVLTGPRQSGKTTILFKLIENLLKQNFPIDSLFFFNCDNFEIQSLFENVSNFLPFINQLNPPAHALIFIDEIQRISNPGIFLKQIFDLKMNSKIIVSGSSSLEIDLKLKKHWPAEKLYFIFCRSALMKFFIKTNFASNC